MRTHTLTAEQAILHVTEDSSFRPRCSKGTKSSRDRVFPNIQKKRRGKRKTEGEEKDLAEAPEETGLTGGAVEAREPRFCGKASLEQNGLDQSSTQYGCSSSDLRVPMLNVLQDVTDVLLLCLNKHQSRYFSMKLV